MRYAVALPSCTSAIHLALAALGVGPGDEVIVPEITWIASAAPITYLGATPVFADVDPVTWCLSVQSLEERITPRTKAVIPVDLYGGMPDYNALRRAAAEHGVALVEDAAEALGSESSGRKAGTFGLAGTFSFHGSKTITTGEGGMLVTECEDLYRRVLFLRDHGRHPGDVSFCNAEVAYKYKMSSLQAALGLAQIERADELVERKRQIFGWYRARLGACPWLRLNAEPAGTKNSFWMVTILLDPRLAVRKEELIGLMAREKIACRPMFHPLSSLPAYRGLPSALEAREKNRVAYALSPWGINLPSALILTEAQVDRVCSVLLEILERAARRSALAA